MSEAPMVVAMIAAVARNGIIGLRGEIPWRLPEDLRWFRRTTMGHHVVMGRKTWESLGRPLPGRQNIVVSRNPALVTPGAWLVPDLASAITRAREAGEDELFVIGGGELYKAALPLAQRIYLTKVDAAPVGDCTFPDLDPAHWTVVARPGGGDGPPAFEFEVLECKLFQGAS